MRLMGRVKSRGIYIRWYITAHSVVAETYTSLSDAPASRSMVFYRGPQPLRVPATSPRRGDNLVPYAAEKSSWRN